MVETPDISRLTADELMEVVNLYPWFGAAQMELCVRMAGRWGEEDFARAALHIASRRKVAAIARSGGEKRWSDDEVSSLLQSYSAPQRKVRAAGGDFFSQNDYDRVRREDDRIFSSFAAKTAGGKEDVAADLEILDDFCTEPIARIYSEQGYFEQARYIYSKLILRYPEKNTYFAAQIEKLGNITDN